jgi:hypothetical protein
MRTTLLLLLLAFPLAAAPAAAPKRATRGNPAAKAPAAVPAPAPRPRPFHLILEANPAAPFPFLGKFGATTLHVYPSGLRAETLWLNAFTRNGSEILTIENPLARLYADVPFANVPAIVATLSPYQRDFGEHAVLLAPVAGRISNLAAMRYRVSYGPAAWIDVWTTSALPESLAVRALLTALTRGISPTAATLLQQIPGLPIEAELHFSHYDRVPILKIRSLTYDASGEETALQTAPLAVRTPMAETLLESSAK